MLTGIPPSEDKIWPMENDGFATGSPGDRLVLLEVPCALILIYLVVFNVIGSQEKAKYLTSIPGL